MKKYLFFSLMALISFEVSFSQKIVTDSVRIDGQMRCFKMFLPDGLPQNAPLVFVVHGYGGNMQENTPVNAAAQRHHFALCIPQGLKDPTGHRCWNVGYPFQKGWKVNDVKALEKMALTVQKRYGLSKNNTFLCGISNGGEMCYLLAYSGTTVFKALGSVAGLTLEWMYRNLEAPHPIPFFEIHGTKDHTSEWFGDLPNKGGWGAYLPVPQAVNYVVAKNRCTYETIDTIPGTNNKSGRTIIQHKYKAGTAGTEVWLYEVVNAPHCWFTDDMDPGEELWKFFSKYVK